MTQNDYVSKYYGNDLPDDMREGLLQTLAGEPVIGSPDVIAFVLHEMGFDGDIVADDFNQDDVPEGPDDEDGLLPDDILSELEALLG